jgi:hypothetical protein
MQLLHQLHSNASASTAAAALTWKPERSTDSDGLQGLRWPVTATTAYRLKVELRLEPVDI